MQKNIDEKLIEACDRLDVNTVRKALEEDANPNPAPDLVEQGNIISNVIMAAWWEEQDDRDNEDAAEQINARALEIVSCLLEHGTDPNQGLVEDDGTSFWTPIYDAVHYGHDTQLADLLIQHGADVNLPHNDEGNTVYDMESIDWGFYSCDMDRREGETPYQSYRRKGRHYFMFREFLLEHSAKRYRMVHLDYPWEKTSEAAVKFLTACMSLDLSTLKSIVAQDANALGYQDDCGDNYSDYLIEWASHFSRYRYAGRREEFERAVIECLEFLVSQDSSPCARLQNAARQSLFFGYPEILKWTMDKLNSIDPRQLQEDLPDFVKIYRTNIQYLLPKDKCVQMEDLLQIPLSERGTFLSL